MKDDNEICAKCKKPKSKHYGRRMTVHPYGWELACTVNGIDRFTPREMVSVPKEFVEAARELCDEIGFCTCHESYRKMQERGIRKYDPACVYHNLPSAVDVRSMLDQIDGKDGGE